MKRVSQLTLQELQAKYDSTMRVGGICLFIALGCIGIVSWTAWMVNSPDASDAELRATLFYGPVGWLVIPIIVIGILCGVLLGWLGFRQQALRREFGRRKSA